MEKEQDIGPVNVEFSILYNNKWDRKCDHDHCVYEPGRVYRAMKHSYPESQKATQYVVFLEEEHGPNGEGFGELVMELEGESPCWAHSFVEVNAENLDQFDILEKDEINIGKWLDTSNRVQLLGDMLFGSESDPEVRRDAWIAWEDYTTKFRKDPFGKLKFPFQFLKEARAKKGIKDNPEEEMFSKLVKEHGYEEITDDVSLLVKGGSERWHRLLHPVFRKETIPFVVMLVNNAEVMLQTQVADALWSERIKFENDITAILYIRSFTEETAVELLTAIIKSV